MGTCYSKPPKTTTTEKKTEMTMKRVYLAGPMRGYPKFNYPEFNNVAAVLRGQGYFVFNPAEAAPSKGSTLAQYLMVDLQWIASHADMIVLLEGWSKSAGAKVEKALAEYLGLEVKYKRGTDMLGSLSDEPTEYDKL